MARRFETDGQRVIIPTAVTEGPTTHTVCYEALTCRGTLDHPRVRLCQSDGVRTILTASAHL